MQGMNLITELLIQPRTDWETSYLKHIGGVADVEVPLFVLLPIRRETLRLRALPGLIKSVAHV